MISFIELIVSSFLLCFCADHYKRNIYFSPALQLAAKTAFHQGDGVIYSLRAQQEH